MIYNKLGRTGLSVSAICLGTMTWGRQNTESEGHEQMDYALAQGVNFFDTAEMYAVPPSPDTYGKTEQIIGSWFAARKNRDKVILASKVAGPGLAWVRGGDYCIDPANIRAALDGSLKRLQTDYIDLYQLHWPNRPHYHFGGHWNFQPQKTDPEKEKESIATILGTLGELVREGKIRHIGLSNETAWGVMQYLAAAERDGTPRVSAIQNEYSLTCRIFEPDLAEVAVHEQVGLLAYSPLAAGALSGKYLDGQVPPGSRRSLLSSATHRATEQASEAVRSYIELARRRGLDVCQMAIAFVCSRPFVTAAIIGATSMEQLKTDIAAIDVKLGDEVLQDIAKIHRQFPVPY